MRCYDLVPVAGGSFGLPRHRSFMPTTTASPPTPTLADPLPRESLPSPPAGFVPLKYRDFLGFRPTSREVAAASLVITDLARNDDYQATFGSTAPTVARITDILQAALAWRNLRSRTEAWDEYVKAQDALAWKLALTCLADLRPLFLAAVGQKQAIARMYPGLVQMFEAPKLVANQGIVTRKKNARARKAAAAEAAATAATATPTATEPAATPVEAPVAPTKTITVNV